MPALSARLARCAAKAWLYVFADVRHDRTAGDDDPLAP